MLSQAPRRTLPRSASQWQSWDWDTGISNLIFIPLQDGSLFHMGKGLSDASLGTAGSLVLRPGGFQDPSK